MNSLLKKTEITLCTLMEAKKTSSIPAFCLDPPKDRLHFYMLEHTSPSLRLFFHIPEKNTPPLDHFILIGKKQITILCSTQREYIILKEHLNKIAMLLPEKTSMENLTSMEFLCTWLHSFIQDDLIFINQSEKELSLLEEKILKNAEENFHRNLQAIKQKISRLSRYYSQMHEFTDELMDQKKHSFAQEEIEHFEKYKKRLEHLSDETKFLREYLMEIQELYQTEIDIRQNHIMKTLTIFATIFFPLSLISGWYGMNFPNMPEFTNPYSYPIVMAISICIVILSLILIKKKKYW